MQQLFMIYGENTFGGVVYTHLEHIIIFKNYVKVNFALMPIKQQRKEDNHSLLLAE